MSTITKRIILAGEKRSGTNIPRLALNMDPSISAPHPPHILQRMGALIDSYGDLNDDLNWSMLVQNVIRLIELDPVPWHYTVPGTEAETKPVELKREAIESRCQERSLVAVFVAVMDLFAELEGSTGWFSKSGQDIRYAEEVDRYCERYFGEAPKWIWLHRDPRDVALSSSKAPIGPKHPFSCAKRWSKLNRLCCEYHQRNPESMMRLGYEDFVSEPEQQLQRICEFVGIEFNSVMLNFHDSDEAKRAASTSPLWGNLDKPISTGSVGKFKNEMSDDDVRIIESVAAPIMDTLGYSRTVHLGEQIFFDNDTVRSWELIDRNLQDAAKAQMPEKELRARSSQWMLLDEIARHAGSC